jgi:hypothetical protein
VRHLMTLDTIKQALPGISQRALDKDPNVQVLARLFGRLIAEIDLSIQENMEILEEDSWALLNAMQERAMEQVRACIVLYSHGYYAPAEALCRTAVEAALNLHYCGIGDTCDLILSYFKSYIYTERKQNDLWYSSVDKAKYPEDVMHVHREKIMQKNETLDLYEDVVTEAFQSINYSYANAKSTWPSIFERFEAIGKEVNYRTVYTALCSQAHNDPEDFLNNFVHSLKEDKVGQEMQEFENQNFTLYMVLIALSFLIDGTAIYLAKFNPDESKRFLNILDDLMTEVQYVIQKKPQEC